MALIDRLRRATFKGVEFLVESSSISFGQKTVVHNYPNSNRTEVEFLGASEDVFSLEIYVYSIEDDYIGKRNLLKDILNQSGEGLLVHPYEGEVRCSVVDKVSLVEEDRSLGIAKFSVTFQKTSKYLYPTTALNNISKIRNLFIQLKNAYKNKVIDEYYFEGILPDGFISTKQQLTGLYREFEIIKTIVPLDSFNASNYDNSIATFQDNINSSAVDSEIMADNLDNVMSSLENLAVNDVDNLKLYESLFDFGAQKIISPELTVKSSLINKNYALITNYINILMLALSYNIIALIDFITDVEMNEIEVFLENQYQYVYPNLTSDIAYILNNLRNEARKYFDNQDVRRVIDKEITGNPLVKLCYLLYDNINDYEQIYSLNNRETVEWYDGTKKVLTNV